MKKLLLLLVVGIIAGCNSLQHSSPSARSSLQKSFSEAETGNQAFAQGNYQKASDAYGHWLSKNPKDINALVARGRSNILLKQYGMALQDLEAAIKIKPSDLRPLTYKARIFLIQNQLQQAKTTLASIMSNSAFAMMPMYEKFWVYYMDGQLANSIGNYDKALASLGEAIKVYDLNPQAFKQQGSPHVKRFAVYQAAAASYHKGYNAQAAAGMEQYIALSQKAGSQISSKDYQSLALAYYMADNLPKCKAVLPNVSPEDRQKLHDHFGDSFFIEQ